MFVVRDRYASPSYIKGSRRRGCWLADRSTPLPPASESAGFANPSPRPSDRPFTLLILAPFASQPSNPQSLAGKTKHQLWLELCDIITKHPAEITALPVEAILRGGIRKFTDEVGRLWVSLADFYIRRGLFEKARDVYEEGANTVVTVRDFDMIFNAFTQFEDSMITAKMEADGDEGDPEDIPPEDFLLKDVGEDLSLRLARLEHLAERRPELLSSVMLRQNPHNVNEWLKRVGLFDGNPTRQILTFTEAVKTVLPDKATGRPPLLWSAFARFYEDHGDVGNARVIFEKSTAVPYKAVDDLAHVWCEWAEMELRHKQFNKALELMRRSTAQPDRVHFVGKAEEQPVQYRLHKSLKARQLQERRCAAGLILTFRLCPCVAQLRRRGRLAPRSSFPPALRRPLGLNATPLLSSLSATP